MTGHLMHDAAHIRQFSLAGLATLTLKSLRTDKHYTYKIKQAVDNETGEEKALWFVMVLTNGDVYRYAGSIIGAGEDFRLTRGSKFTEDAECVKAFGYFWQGIKAGAIKPLLEIRHEGRCGRCGRELTTPESVDTGFGPECSARLGIAWETRS